MYRVKATEYSKQLVDSFRSCQRINVIVGEELDLSDLPTYIIYNLLDIYSVVQQICINDYSYNIVLV